MVLPDTPLVKEAERLARAACAPPVFAHCQRTFLKGEAYGRHRGRPFDAEGLYLAALFHDLGLSDAHRDTSRPFPRVGSDLLRERLRAQGEPEARVGLLGEAIDLHMQLLPRWSRGEEVGLLQVGAWMDVIGLRRGSVADAARAIDAALPRDGFGFLRFNLLLMRSFGSVASCLGLLAPPRSA